MLAGFAEIRVPHAVWSQVLKHRPQALERPGIGFLRLSALAVPSPALDALAQVFSLHDGEPISRAGQAALPCAAMISVGNLSKEQAARLGITMKHQANGDAGEMIWLEFKQE